ncbi:MAG: pesticin C-terminus-like muramidase [Deltaproteobacteria bacterium]|jgi:hypothetical protein|nr:pesticin C-terminus-like muramidase [Deltaproteobacteria bacterium]
MPVRTDYIRSVLERFEGRRVSAGYVPADASGKPLGSSGVTVATGLDLGQQTVASLEGMGLPAALIDRFRPYLGARQEEARNMLAQSPLTLTPEEVERTDAAVHAKYIDETAELFGRAGFETAPGDVQAVAVSLHYQFGSPWRRASPALGAAFEALRRGEYAAAADLLEDPSGWSPPHRQYLARRKAEAMLLRQAEKKA